MLFYYFILRSFLLLMFAGDHALIDINKLLGLNPKQVTVLTKSRDSQSADSVPTPIPSAALKSKMSKV
jgi:RIMS-binding protein 2